LERRTIGNHQRKVFGDMFAEVFPYSLDVLLLLGEVKLLG
jgi:hypothetical protein